MEEIIYTQEEDLLNQRKELNKTIQHVRKQKENWELLYISQLKLI